ncbi:WD40-repeat-containing domain protein [Rhypophila decipiens]|uniref:WD40-repeat-containing domain protein n=1 Tax=Rhypophila decipiens TaxID=261697 RepID=A0AAN7B996_9PEZI|nr:WD40-repeat-containing domain protein [Rhypophila decipiens]
MDQLLFERSTGNVPAGLFARLHTTKLLNSFRPAPGFRFDGGERLVATPVAVPSGQSDDGHAAFSIWAHQAGVNALALERFDGRILISGGSDATIKIWDLEQCGNPNPAYTYRPVSSVARAGQPPQPLSAARRGTEAGLTARPSTSTSPTGPVDKAAGHRFGITHLSFYPFDSDAFLSCSYDQTLKLWSTRNARVSGTFDLGAKVYTHAISLIASHLLVACGTQHPAVRLVDLRSSAAVQSLISPGQLGGSAGANLAVAWSPVHEHVLASGSVDGAVRIWDIRKSNGLIGLLDQEDSLGILHPGRAPPPGTFPEGTLQARGIRQSARAHHGPVNGLTWTDDGEYIVSAGHDRKIRVWSSATGANTLANFGPTIRNRHVGSLGSCMLVSPTGLTSVKKEILVFPNETEILIMDLHEGTIITRLRGMGPGMAAVRAGRGGERTVKNRLTSVVWRGAGGFAGSSGVVMGGRTSAGGLYSGHLDGQIRVWMPQLDGLDNEDEDEASQEVADARAKKRKVLDDAFKSLMGRQITFS